MASIKMSIRVRTTMTIGKKEKTFNIALNGITSLRIVANSYNYLLAASPCVLLSACTGRSGRYTSLSVSGTKLPDSMPLFVVQPNSLITQKIEFLSNSEWLLSISCHVIH